MTKMTAAELQALADKFRSWGGPVHYIPASAVPIFTEWQVPHIVVRLLPESCQQ